MSEARTFDITGYVRVYECPPGKFSLGICIYDSHAQAIEIGGDQLVAVARVRVQGKVGDGLAAAAEEGGGA